MTTATDRFFVSDDKQLLDLDVIHGFLSTCYWSPGIPRATVQRAIENSLCFGVFERKSARAAQVGFTRIISDYATFAYVCDVFVLESHRGHGLSRMMMQAVLAHPRLQGLRRICLLTRDAHGVYEKFGFRPRCDNGKSFMEIANLDVYGPGNRAKC